MRSWVSWYERSRSATSSSIADTNQGYESRGLRVAGFALFGLALAKLFLYDLAYLSSITRALSFLAVGAVLLLAGFFYQRVTADLREAPS